jgi:hypothetical protein
MPNEAEENARTAYEAAVELWIEAGEQNWSRFNGMVLVNTIIAAIIAQVFGGQINPPYAWILPIFGLLVSIAWWPLLKRGLAYQDYFVAAARELERHYLAPVNVVVRGHNFAQGQPVEVDGGPPRQMPLDARVRSRTSMLLVVALFSALYLAAAAYLLRHDARPTLTAIPKRGGQFLLVDRDGAPKARLEVSPEGSMMLELSEKEGKIIWKSQ